MLNLFWSGVAKFTGRTIFITNQGMAPLHEVNIPTEKATFAMGCFWGPDSLFGATPGVVRTRVGFTGGSKNAPTYKNLGDHTEAIEIDFDPKSINYEQLLNLFWSNHDATARCTKQYTSILFYHNDNQKSLAEKTLKEQQAKVKSPVVTTVESASQFYDAEDYHQKYRLQQYPELMSALGLRRDTAQLTGSHVAARLNGYVVGAGGVAQFEAEADKLGLAEPVKEIVQNFPEFLKKFKELGALVNEDNPIKLVRACVSHYYELHKQ